MPKQKASEPLFDQLSKALETQGEELVSKLKVSLNAILSLTKLPQPTSAHQPASAAPATHQLRGLTSGSIRILLDPVGTGTFQNR